METKICKHCKSEIDIKAKVCPHCRRSQGGKLKFVLIGLAALFILFLLIPSGEDTTTTSSDKTTESKELKDKKEVSNEFKVGDVVETDNLTISFLSAEDYKSDNEFIQPKDGNKYVRAEFEFENTSDGDEVVTSWDFECYADGYSAEQTYFDAESLDATLSAGKKTKGFVFYEVPKESKSVTLEYETNFWTDDKIIFIVK